MTRPAPADIARWQRNLQGEVDGSAIYQGMAAGTPDPRLAAHPWSARPSAEPVSGEEVAGS